MRPQSNANGYQTLWCIDPWKAIQTTWLMRAGAISGEASGGKRSSAGRKVCPSAAATCLAGQKALQLHFLQPAQGAAKRKGEITVGIQVPHRHRRLDVQRHAAVVTFVHHGDEAAHAVVLHRERG